MGQTQGLIGASAITLAIAFNVPYAILAATYDYPQVLRRPAGEALDLFARGGPGLVLTWHGFALSALAIAPLAIALALTRARLASRPILALGAAITGSLAGFAQAIGLWRWVFVVPGLARMHVDPAATGESRLSSERTFDLINQYGGVAIGEHLGQVLTALFVCCLSGLQWNEARRITAAVGGATAIAILIGANEGVAVALGGSGESFALATIIGFLGLTVWLILTGVGLIRGSART